MSVQKKVLLIGSCIILMTAGTFFVKGLSWYGDEIEYRTTINEDQVTQVLQNLQEYLFEGYKIRIKALVELDQPLKAALISRDKAKALEIASRKYKVLKKENPYVNLLQFHLPDGNIFFRVKGEPENSNDKRAMVEEARKTGKTVSGCL